MRLQQYLNEDMNYTEGIEFVKNNQERPGGDELVVSTATLIAFAKKITPIIIKQVEAPAMAIQNSEDAKNEETTMTPDEIYEKLSGNSTPVVPFEKKKKKGQ